MAADEEFVRERVDGFGADAVQADAELEDLVVIFGAGVYFRDTIDHFAERDAAAEIAHRHAVVLDVNLDFLAVAHDVFVNRIIDDLFEQDVTAIVLVRSIANPPDIHTRAQPDMLQGGQCLNFALVVNVFRRIGHKLLGPEYSSDKSNLQTENMIFAGFERAPFRYITADCGNRSWTFRLRKRGSRGDGTGSCTMARISSMRRACG